MVVYNILYVHINTYAIWFRKAQSTPFAFKATRSRVRHDRVCSSQLACDRAIIFTIKIALNSH